MEKKSKFFWLKIAITIISFGGAVLFKSTIYWTNIQNNYIDLSLLKEIAYDLSIGVFSAMILVWFIDEIGQHIQARQSKEKECAIIKRFDRVLQQYIDRYVTMYYCVVTPLEERLKQVTGPDSTMDAKMPEIFYLKDMRDLYQSSLLLRDGTSDSSISAFLDIEFSLRNEFIHLVENNNFEHYTSFPDIFLRFVNVSLKYDCRGNILEAPKRKVGEKPMATFISECLENDADDFYEKVLAGRGIGGNLMSPYILLYEMMKQERKIILEYQEEIKKLN